MRKRNNVLYAGIVTAMLLTGCAKQVEIQPRTEIFKVGERTVYLDEITSVKLEYLKRDFIIEEVVQKKLTNLGLETGFSENTKAIEESKDPIHLKLVIASQRIADKLGKSRDEVIKEIFTEVDSYEDSD